MVVEKLVANYSPVGDMITMIICWVLLFVIVRVLSSSRDRKFVFLKRSLHFILFGAGSNIGFYLAISKYECTSWVLYLLRDIYHISFLCCMYCFILYMKNMLDVKGLVANTVAYVTRIVFCLCAILDLFSPITKVGFYEKDGLWYDSLVSAYNFFYVYTLLILCAMLLIYSKRLIRSLRVCLIATEIVVVVIMIYQGFLNINSFSGFTYILPVLVVFILIHSKPFDDKTGALGASSLENFIQQANKSGISVDYMVLKLYVSVIDQLSNELGKVLNSFWHSSFKDAELFSLSSDLYVLAIPRGEKNGNTVKKMDELIDVHFPKYYEQFKLPYKMVKFYDVNFIDTVSDLRGILKYLLQIMEENSTFVVDEKVKEQLKQYKIIGDHLSDIDNKNNLDDERVLVYCQPIRNMRTGKYDTAEALMRLSLPELGLVMPGMFIEIAEQYNHIHALSRIMLNKVCKQIKALEEGYYFKRISVNFVASEIKADSFCDEILDIINSNGIEPSRIGIELTESQTESDFQIVNKKMKILRDAGMTLYLDDVGTGYSNLDRIVRYDVDVVKFDRFFLLEAEKSMKIVKMMKHLSDAFRDLDYKLLYEGVETEAHEALCQNCGADYIQGFKYSKPVPIKELRDYFNLTSEIAMN